MSLGGLWLVSVVAGSIAYPVRTSPDLATVDITRVSDFAIIKFGFSMQ